MDKEGIGNERLSLAARELKSFNPGGCPGPVKRGETFPVREGFRGATAGGQDNDQDINQHRQQATHFEEIGKTEAAWTIDHQAGGFQRGFLLRPGLRSRSFRALSGFNGPGPAGAARGVRGSISSCVYIHMLVLLPIWVQFGILYM